MLCNKNTDLFFSIAIISYNIKHNNLIEFNLRRRSVRMKTLINPFPDT